MAINLKRLLRIGTGGQNARKTYHGIFAFTTTGATASVVVPIGRVECAIATPVGTPASDEVLSVNNTVSGTAGTDNASMNGSNGATTLVVTRTGASKTSGLNFSIIAVGY